MRENGKRQRLQQGVAEESKTAILHENGAFGLEFSAIGISKLKRDEERSFTM